jgi:hypothetical protein
VYLSESLAQFVPPHTLEQPNGNKDSRGNSTDSVRLLRISWRGGGEKRYISNKDSVGSMSYPVGREVAESELSFLFTRTQEHLLDNALL